MKMSAAPPERSAAARSVRPGTSRLFFALWPEASVRQGLASVAGIAHVTCGGRLMQARNLHLTLAFLGDTENHWRARAIDAARRVKMDPFELVIDRSGYFRQGRNRGVVWAGCELIPPLARLSHDLRQALVGAGVRFDSKAFVPHVTLLRDVLRDANRPSVPLAFEPLRWVAESFVLVASGHDAGGVRYEVVAEPLGRI